MHLVGDWSCPRQKIVVMFGRKDKRQKTMSKLLERSSDKCCDNCAVISSVVIIKGKVI